LFCLLNKQKNICKIYDKDDGFSLRPLTFYYLFQTMRNVSVFFLLVPVTSTFLLALPKADLDTILALEAASAVVDTEVAATAPKLSAANPKYSDFAKVDFIVFSPRKYYG